MHFTVVISRAVEGGYTANVPALPGCFTQGETLEETKQNAREAILLYVECMAEDGEPIPQDQPPHLQRMRVAIPQNAKVARVTA